MAKAKSPIPEGFHSVTPQLTFDDGAAAIDWYKQALGAEEKGRAVGPDGKIVEKGCGKKAVVRQSLARYLREPIASPAAKEL